MSFITTVNDLKPIYKRRVPKMFYDYTESGSWTEQTFRENSSDFNRLYFRQKVAVDISNRTTTSQMIGERESKVYKMLVRKETEIGFYLRSMMTF